MARIFLPPGSAITTPAGARRPADSQLPTGRLPTARRQGPAAGSRRATRRRLWRAASSEIRCNRSVWRSNRSGFHRTTDRSVCEQLHAVDAEFGCLLHHPVEPVALRNRRRNRERIVTLRGADVAAALEPHGIARADHGGGVPPAGAVADRDRFAVAQPQHPPEMVFGVRSERNDARLERSRRDRRRRVRHCPAGRSRERGLDPREQALFAVARPPHPDRRRTS